jgi:hypothetical protein
VTAPIKIFLSYRRDDTSGHALHLHEDLAERYEEVFMDIGMKPGASWKDEIESKIGSCDAFVALIGPRWLTAADSKGRRLENPKDPLRQEIEAAVWREVPLFPVLVEDAEMPTEEDLPTSLAPLSERQALEIRNRSWRSDVEELFETLDEVAAGKAPPPTPPRSPPPPPPRRRRPSRRALIAAAAVLLVAVAAVGGVLLLTGGGGGEPERIAYAADGAIYTIGVDGTGREELTGPSDSGSPDWSPDGERLAIAGEGIWVMDASGENARRISSGTNDGSPAWAPERELIAFNRTDDIREDGRDVWVIGPDGSGARNLMPGDASGAAPDWSPDGDRIVFQRQTRLWLMDAEGGGERPLDVEGIARRPSWSPVADEVAAAVLRDRVWDIYVVDVASGTAENITRGGFDTPDAPAWSAEGDKIVFAAVDGLWVVSRDGTGPQRVVRGSGNRSPSWQP